ncbi:hypothetical protein P3S68_015173 [Capsicum galapagoense]
MNTVLSPCSKKMHMLLKEKLMHVGDDIDISSSGMSHGNRRLIRIGGGMEKVTKTVIPASRQDDLIQLIMRGL